jgi:hypothetical protein
MGCPARPDVEWTDESARALQRIGFNAVQLNIAWGPRPADEPLNLEDVVELPEAEAREYPQPVPLRCDPSPERRERRRADLRLRIAVARQAGLRTIFHFGAPFNAHESYGDNPPNCLQDPKVVRRYELLIETLNGEFPGIDDLLLYTYDQDAWLCSEFGTCPRCVGAPLHGRVAGFVNALAAAWRRLNPNGRLWWEPWELSAGQALRAAELLDASCVGLSLHSNIAEVQAAIPVDRWLELTVRMAKSRGIPVIVEHFLSSPTEEMEPFTHIGYPLVTLRSLRKIAGVGADGIKEYYGIVPSASDANLAMTAAFLADPSVSDEEALRRLSASYGDAAASMPEFWRLQSAAMELFPWYTSWFIREVGRSGPAHSMRAAFIRGQQAHTPSWESTRRAIFMKTDESPPDPWMLEDVQLQCEMSAARMAEALRVGESIRDLIPEGIRDDFAAGLEEMEAWRRITLSYALHIRETNLTRILRRHLASGSPLPDRVLHELKETLTADIANQGEEEPCRSALSLLESDPEKFAQSLFCDADPAEVLGGWRWSGSIFSVTSR